MYGSLTAGDSALHAMSTSLPVAHVDQQDDAQHDDLGGHQQP
jgi:hypothetical protein